MKRDLCSSEPRMLRNANGIEQRWIASFRRCVALKECSERQADGGCDSDRDEARRHVYDLRCEVRLSASVTPYLTLTAAGCLLMIACGDRKTTSKPAIASRQIESVVSDASPPSDASAPLSARAQIKQALAVDTPTTRLRKADIRPAMKTLAPHVTACYEAARAVDAHVSGVINTKLTISNEPALGMILTVHGFETHGTLGQSREFLDCVTKTFEAAVLPPVAMRGQLDALYPFTFSPEPVDNRDKPILEKAARLAKEHRWTDALAEAERGLLLVTIDGTVRHPLIKIAGLSACNLKDEQKARHYFALASPEFEDALQHACLEHAGIDLLAD